MSGLTSATEAGARAWFDQQQARRRDDGRLRPDGKPWQFDDLTPTDQHAIRSLVLPIVTAVVAERGGEPVSERETLDSLDGTEHMEDR